MTYRVRFRLRPAQVSLPSRFPLRASALHSPAIQYSSALSSTPRQRLYQAVRAIQRRYGRRVVTWPKAQIHPGTRAQRTL